MRLKSWSLALAAMLAAGSLEAQGVTTGAISGVVLDSAGTGLADAQIQVTNRSTGFTTATVSRAGGRFLAQGLEVGGPYSVTVRRLGFSPQTRNDLMVSLGENVRVEFRLQAQATALAAVQVVATPTDFSPSNQGTKTTLSDTALKRLPTLNRNINDFVRLTPQVSTSGPGNSGGGMPNRMNNVQIDGATERDVFGLGSTGQPGAQAGARSVSIEAVKELQILLAPFDVRQGAFGGLLINAVTQHGTNTMRGSAFASYRNSWFGADVPPIRATAYNRAQFGFTVGGPIQKDKLHFFIAPEFQTETSPLSGPYLGQDAALTPAFPTAESNLTQIQSIATGYGLTNIGSAGAIEIPNPLRNVFGRLDYRINDIHRAVFRYNYGYANLLRTQNGRSASTVVYSSNFHDFNSTKHAPVFQLFSNFANGSSNELIVGYNRVRDRRTPPQVYPQITVTAVPRTGGGNATVIFGADQFSQGNELDQDTYEFTNNFTWPRGSHTLTFGTRNEYVRIRNLFSQSSYGVWAFNGMTNFQNGVPSSYRVALIRRDGGNVYFNTLVSALYAQDQWQATPNLTATFGIRADIPFILSKPYHSADVARDIGRNTEEVPSGNPQISPRFGFNWDITGDQVNQLRGGVGLFVGTPPYVWIENVNINSGEVIRFANCGGAGQDPAPPFNTANASNPPAGCLPPTGTPAVNPIGAVNFIDKDLKYPQPMRATLAFDRQLPWGLVGTLEGLYSKNLNNFFFVNRQLGAPRGTDNRGRVLFGDTIRTNGVSVPFRIYDPRVYTEVIDVENQSMDYSYSLTTQLRKHFSSNWSGMVAYTYSKSRDVQSPTSSTHISNWRFGRTLATDQFEPELGRSLFDQPHRFVATGTWTIPWWQEKFPTDISLIWSGQSGDPHDYIYAAVSSGSGDLNADGSQGNDLIYVPRNALDPTEILFRDQANVASGAQQAQAFENFIRNSDCLSKYRGRIMERNACTSPFWHRADLSIRQQIPTLSGQRLAIQLDVFNFSNALGEALGQENWGKRRVNTISTFNNVPLLDHVGQTVGPATTSNPIFNFNTSRVREYQPANSADNFWRTQISVRYSF
jgi:hypothetical protein